MTMERSHIEKFILAVFYELNAVQLKRFLQDVQSCSELHDTFACRGKNYKNIVYSVLYLCLCSYIYTVHVCLMLPARSFQSLTPKPKEQRFAVFHLS